MFRAEDERVARCYGEQYRSGLRMGEKLLYLLRHGDTGMTGRYLGSSDLGLSERGMRQLEKTRLHLHDAGIETVYCSPLLRCRQTFDLLGLTVRHQFCHALREIDFGRWEGKSFEDVVRIDKELVDSWKSRPERFCFPGGESVPRFRERVEQFKKQLESTGDKKILVVSHGGVIRHLLCLTLGLCAEKYLIFDVRPGKFCSVRLFGEYGVLTGFNLGG